MTLVAHRSRILYVFITAALAVAALRPVSIVERVLDVCVAPARVLGELAAPLSWWRQIEVRAAVARVEERTRAEIAASRALLEVERAFARPSDPSLLAGRGALHAEVVARREDDLDRVVIQLPYFAGENPVVPGLPVVSGDHYVGRVSAVDEPRPGQATVDLVTGDDFFVGARLVTEAPPGRPLAGQPPCRLVVGGLAPNTAHDDRELYLSVHNPSRRDPAPAPVVVHELIEESDALASLADGYALGDLQVVTGETAQVLRVVPRIDYREGLYQVLVLLPTDRVPAGPGHLSDAFDDRRWVPARVLLDGDPSFWRRGRKVTTGLRHGVAQGAALALGARFVGRVRRAGLFTADVSLMADPGLVVPALARVEGVERPLVLGHLVSRGPAGGGAVYFRWNPEVGLPEEVREAAGSAASVAATLYTGSGEAGVPRGLMIGSCALPLGPGEHTLTVATDPAVRSPGLVLVRLTGGSRGAL